MNPQPTPKITIIITSRNNEQTIEDCLNSIFNQNYPKDGIEVILVDACSTDTTAKIAQKFPAQVFSLPINAAAAYNYATKKAGNDILGFVDADAKVEPDWLRKLVVHLENPQIAGVSGAIETWNTENPWARIIGYELKNRYNRIHKYVGRIATMNLLLKKKILTEVGGWDENLPSQYDTDLGYRITRRGYKFAYEPKAKCYHFNRPTLKTYFKQQLQYGKNTAKLYFKHSNLIKGDEITDFGMNIQPALLLVMIAFFLIGIPDSLRLSWLVSGALLTTIIVYYFFSAVKISLIFKDKTAMRLVLLYFLRAIAWLSGAAIAATEIRLRKRGTNKNG
jgi:cellulose synthase/poly-beta-1,6-N-acetylglucosamine synthase-like glycosyltransferase